MFLSRLFCAGLALPLVLLRLDFHFRLFLKVFFLTARFLQDGPCSFLVYQHRVFPPPTSFFLALVTCFVFTTGATLRPFPFSRAPLLFPFDFPFWL